MTLHPRPHGGPRDTPRSWQRGWARALRLLTAGLVLAHLAGCAAQFWPPSAWSLSVDLPFVHPKPAAASPVAASPDGPLAPTLKDPVNMAEALAYAEALCALSPDELNTEIERLQNISAQDGYSPLRAQQLAFAQRLAQLYAERQHLQESNDKQAQQLRDRQRRIDQLTGQIEAMRAVEYSLPAAAAGGPAPHGSAAKPAGAAAPRGATSFAIPSAPAVSKSLPASGAEPAASRDEPDAKVGEDTHPPSEP